MGELQQLCPGTPQLPITQHAVTLLLNFYVGIDSCLAAECWLYAISVMSRKGWEISALERGPKG